MGGTRSPAIMWRVAVLYLAADPGGACSGGVVRTDRRGEAVKGDKLALVLRGVVGWADWGSLMAVWFGVGWGCRCHLVVAGPNFGSTAPCSSTTTVTFRRPITPPSPLLSPAHQGSLAPARSPLPPPPPLAPSPRARKTTGSTTGSTTAYTTALTTGSTTAFTTVRPLFDLCFGLCFDHISDCCPHLGSPADHRIDHIIKGETWNPP